MTLTQIIDHVPQMLDELCVVFSEDKEPDFETIRASSQHGYIRAAEGYSLTELLRELELLRDCVFDFIAEAEVEQHFNRDDSIRALRRVNKYFSEDILFVVEHYLARQKG
ncbi:MAG: RsbRD N-terminal domain-containing protein [Pyrinomonadaceae bacterium]